MGSVTRFRSYICTNELNTVTASRWLRHHQGCVILHSGPWATRQVLRCRTCGCLLQILLAAEGHTRLKPHMTQLGQQHHVPPPKKNMLTNVHQEASDTKNLCALRKHLYPIVTVVGLMKSMSQCPSYSREVGDVWTWFGLMIRLSWLCKKQARLYWDEYRGRFCCEWTQLLRDWVDNSPE